MKRIAFSFAVGAAASAIGIGLWKYLRGHQLMNRHVDDYRDHWDGPKNRRSSDVIHFVALGDSAAQGVGASSVHTSYVGLIGQRLRDVTGREVEITNLSVSGAVSADVIAAQLPKLAELEFQPDLVTIDIGGNDVVFFAEHTVESFTTNFEEILRLLPAGSYVGDVPWFTIPGLSARAGRMAAQARRLIADHGHHLVPLFEASRETGYRTFHQHTAADWFHPNDKGHQAWAELFWAKLEETGKVAQLCRTDPEQAVSSSA